MKRIFGKNLAKDYEKKIILGLSDTWLDATIIPSNPPHYIEYCGTCGLTYDGGPVNYYFLDESTQTDVWVVCCSICISPLVPPPSRSPP